MTGRERERECACVCSELICNIVLYHYFLYFFMKYSKKVSDTVREVKKNWLEPADGLKKKNNLRQAETQRESRSTKPHVYLNSTG